MTETTMNHDRNQHKAWHESLQITTNHDMNHHDDPKRALHKAIWLPCLTSGDFCHGFQSQGASPCLHALFPACNGFLRFTSGATLADLLAANMAVEPIFYPHTCLRFYPFSLKYHGNFEEDTIKITICSLFYFMLICDIVFRPTKSLADPRGAPGTRAPPPGVQILSFSCSFRQKCEK